MQDKRIKFTDTKYSLIELMLIPVISTMLKGYTAIVIISILALLALIGSIIRFIFEKKSTVIYVLYISEFVGIIVFYCLYAILYNKFVSSNEVNIAFNLVSIIFIVPIIVEYAKRKAAKIC